MQEGLRFARLETRTLNEVQKYSRIVKWLESVRRELYQG